ncbi:hypothetical protein V497_05456 [Pseudogymnoascus sp. VKM F-4516 (FW-969)]|nr:hypothetical protein V497_05456 [Pseudogymnoascus sp. VKM F-4516 (FW-969)]
MSVVSSYASRLKPEIRLAQAVSQFEADLSREQKVAFRNYRSQSQDSPPDPSDVMRLTAEFDRRASNKTGGGRCFGPRLTNFLQSVQQFAALGDIILGGSQNILACGVWSLVRMSLLVGISLLPYLCPILTFSKLIVDFSSYLEKLSTLLMTAGHSAPRYQTMALLYPRSTNLQLYLAEYFIVVVNLCSRMLKFTRKSALGQFASTLSDLDTKQYQSELNNWANAIKEEVGLLMAKTIEEEARENFKFRSLSTQFSKSGMIQQKLKATLRILDSCSIYDYETTWKQTRKIGNTTLFNQTDEYKDWKRQTTSCTLIYTGGLGSGKSVLLANLIDDLHLDGRNKNVTVAYFFCRHDIPESLQARTVIGSLARQLLRPRADLAMVTGFIDRTSTLALDFHAIFSLLKRALPPKSRAYFVLDGLHECDSAERGILIPQLQKLQGTFSLNLCVSVPLDPANSLRLSPDRFIDARVTSIPTNNPDIDAFISAELGSHIESKRLVIGNPLLILEIHDSLLKGSQGMFLWVALQIISLCDMKTDDAIRQALVDLPKNLSETFSRILRKAEESGKTYQRRTLELVITAHRPLTAEELRDALSVVPGDAVWNWSKRLNDVNLILTCCGSLLTIDEEERTIRLVHHSVKQFLLNGIGDSASIQITIDGANKTMANIIVTYLNYGVFTTQLATTVVPQMTTAPSQIIRLTPALSGSVQKLALKLLKSRKQPGFDIGKTLAEAGNLFGSRPMDDYHFHSYAKLYWLQHIFCISEHESVMYDLMCRLFKGNAISINTTDEDGWTPLSLAARDGHEVILKSLLDSNVVGVDAKNPEGRTPLSWAAENGQVAVLKLLLDSDIVDTNSKDREGRTPLSWAAEKGHEAVVELLLVKGSIVEAEDDGGQTPFSYAAENGHEALANLLLNEGAKLDSEDHGGYTPLVWAARNGHEPVVKLLVNKGANLEFKSGGGKTPMAWAAENGHEAVVKILFNNGANLESTSTAGLTPLTWAADSGHEVVVRFLLDKGAKIESKDLDGQTPLSWAARNGREAVVSLLLNNGAELESKDINGNTPLSWSTNSKYKWSETIVKLLLDKGANLESKDNNGQTPLLLATQSSHEAAVMLLLNRGANIESKDINGQTPLLWAARNGCEAVVKLLLNAGADPNSIDIEGQTPLIWAARNEHEAVAKLLLNGGADPKSKDIDGQTALLWATQNRHEALVKLLSSKT